MINKPKILIIDDVRDNISTLKALVKKNFDDAITLTAETGDLGIELAKSTVPDVILLDILMPDKDGFTVCMEIKAIPELSEIPVIFVTALKEIPTVKIRALNVGAEGFLSKPIDQSSFIAMVKAMLKIREATLLKDNQNERLQLLVKEKTHKLRKELEIKKKNELDLLDSRKRYIGLVEILDSGVVVHDSDLSIISANNRACEILGFSPEQILGKTVIDPDWKFTDTKGNDLPLEGYPVQIIAERKEPLVDYSLGIKSYNDNSITWVLVNGYPRFEEEGLIKEIVVSFSDITDLKEKELQLERAAYNDFLTGLHNRRYYEEELINLDIIDNFPLTIVMADINGLKLINDAFGHLTGDELLKSASNLLIENCRETDLLARIGGDEFVIVMPKTTEKEVGNILNTIKNNAKLIETQSIPLSISFGYKTKTAKNEDIQEIYRSAEDLMYREKLLEIPSMRSGAIETILSTLYEKDKNSELHSRSVSIYSERLATAYGMNTQDVAEVKTAGLLHDIGKIIIPIEIIIKEGKLTPEEYTTMKNHSEIGFRILNSTQNMRDISNIVLNHHERWDGGGYPRGIKTEEIPIKSRIISIADAFDAMTSDRTYRDIVSKEEALQEIIDNAGTQFDAELVKVFQENFIEITK